MQSNEDIIEAWRTLINERQEQKEKVRSAVSNSLINEASAGAYTERLQEDDHVFFLYVKDNMRRSLKVLRHNRVCSAYTWLMAAENAYNSYTRRDEIRDEFRLTYVPVYAYFEYKRKKYPEAIALMHEAIDITSRFIAASGGYRRVLYEVQQLGFQINIGKVQYKQGDTAAYRAILLHALQYLYMRETATNGEAQVKDLHVLLAMDVLNNLDKIAV